MAITITNPNAAAYNAVEVSPGVYHIRAYLPAGDITLNLLEDTQVATGLLVTVPDDEQAFLEPYTSELDAFPVSPTTIEGQTNGILNITLRARRDTVASNYVISDQDIIAVLVGVAAPIVEVPDPAGIPGPQGPQGDQGVAGPVADADRLWNNGSDSTLATMTSDNIVFNTDAPGFLVNNPSVPEGKSLLKVKYPTTELNGSFLAYGNVFAEDDIRITGDANPSFTIDGSEATGRFSMSSKTLTISNELEDNQSSIDLKVYNDAADVAGVVLRHSTNTTWRHAVLDNAERDYTSGTDIPTKVDVDAAASDRRLKKEITDMGPKLEQLLSLQPRNYKPLAKLDADAAATNKTLGGFIAQEVQEVFPGLVGERAHNSENEDYLAVKRDALVWEAMFVRALQEQQEMIKSLETKIAKLESK